MDIIPIDKNKSSNKFCGMLLIVCVVFVVLAANFTVTFTMLFIFEPVTGMAISAVIIVGIIKYIISVIQYFNPSTRLTIGFIIGISDELSDVLRIILITIPNITIYIIADRTVTSTVIKSFE